MNGTIELEEDVDPDFKELSLIRTEFDFALNTLTDKNATGIDDILTQVLKNLVELTKSMLFNIIGECYETGKLPNDCIKSKSITILKKRECDKLHQL